MTEVQDGKTLGTSSSLAQGATVMTNSGYAAYSDPVTQSADTLGPDTTVTSTVGALTSTGLAECETASSDCASAAAIHFLPFVAVGLVLAAVGAPAAAILVLGVGVVDLEQKVFNGSIPKVAQILEAGDGQDIIAPVDTTASGGSSRLAHLAKAVGITNVEVRATSAGVSVYVISGRCVVVNRASGSSVKLSAGEDLFIPSNAAQARHEKLKSSVHTFNLKSVKRWWGTKAPSSTQTMVRVFVPWRPNGSLSSGISVVKRVSGSCWTGSIAVDEQNAWRCVASNEILDPCFAPKFSANVVDLACDPAPWNGKVVLLRLTKVLPLSEANPVNSTVSTARSWAIELVNDDKCFLGTGANAAIDDVQMVYYCASGSAAGPLDVGHEPWTVEYEKQGTDFLQPMDVSVAWSG